MVTGAKVPRPPTEVEPGGRRDCFRAAWTPIAPDRCGGGDPQPANRWRVPRTGGVLAHNCGAQRACCSSSALGPDSRAAAREQASVCEGGSGGGLVAPLTTMEQTHRHTRQVSDFYEPLFLLYIFFMCFGVLNVVVGAFVATTQQIAANDPEAAARYAVGQVDNYLHRIRGFFRQADVDQTGTLSWEEFRNHLQDRKVQATWRCTGVAHRCRECLGLLQPCICFLMCPCVCVTAPSATRVRRHGAVSAKWALGPAVLSLLGGRLACSLTLAEAPEPKRTTCSLLWTGAAASSRGFACSRGRSRVGIFFFRCIPYTVEPIRALSKQNGPAPFHWPRCRP